MLGLLPYGDSDDKAANIALGYATLTRDYAILPMLGRSYWPMLAMLMLYYAGASCEHTRILTSDKSEFSQERFHSYLSKLNDEIIEERRRTEPPEPESPNQTLMQIQQTLGQLVGQMTEWAELRSGAVASLCPTR